MRQAHRVQRKIMEKVNMSEVDDTDGLPSNDEDQQDSGADTAYGEDDCDITDSTEFLQERGHDQRTSAAYSQASTTVPATQPTVQSTNTRSQQSTSTRNQPQILIQSGPRILNCKKCARTTTDNSLRVQ